MMEHNPIDPVEKKPAVRPLRCEEWEALLADAIDGTLVAADKAAFYAHSDSCKACAATLEETVQGQQWLQFLRTDPVVPGDLLARILARTSGVAAAGAVEGEAAAGSLVAGDPFPLPARIIPMPPLWKRMSIPALLRRAGEPRMMMTAAMAFFSIALTLNLLGVHLGAAKLSDLKPNTLETNLRRNYMSANARVSRYYDNLRIVYEVESRMREMQRTSEEDQPAPAKQNEKTPDGSAGKAPAPGGKVQPRRNDGSSAYLPGRSQLASLEKPAKDGETAAILNNKHHQSNDDSRRLASADPLNTETSDTATQERSWA